MDQIKYIQNIMPEDAEILVRTSGKQEWFVHYYLLENERISESIYKVYTKNLEESLNSVIDIIVDKL